MCNTPCDRKESNIPPTSNEGIDPIPYRSQVGVVFTPIPPLWEQLKVANAFQTDIREADECEDNLDHSFEIVRHPWVKDI